MRLKQVTVTHGGRVIAITKGVSAITAPYTLTNYTHH